MFLLLRHLSFFRANGRVPRLPASLEQMPHHASQIARPAGFWQAKVRPALQTQVHLFAGKKIAPDKLKERRITRVPRHPPDKGWRIAPGQIEIQKNDGLSDPPTRGL